MVAQRRHLVSQPHVQFFKRSNTLRPLFSPQSPRLSRNVQTLQADANCIVDSFTISQPLDLADLPYRSPVDHTNNETVLNCQSERLAAKQATNDARNYLLAQLPLTFKKKTAAFVSERATLGRISDSWENNKAFVPIKYSGPSSNANVVSFHAMFKRMDRKCVTARIVPWGCRDAAKHKPQTDSPCQNIEIFRLVLSVAAEQRLHII